MKKISVVTVNYNTAASTKELLESLQKVKVPQDFSLSIIVIDNGSKEELVLDEVKNVQLIRLEENTGFTGGYNIGMQKALAADSEYIMIINSDTIASPELLVNQIKVLESNKKIGVTVPKIYFAKGHEFHKNRYKPDELGKVLWYAGGNIDWDHVRSIHRGVDEVDVGQYDNQEKITFATGCCMMIKKEVLEKIGLFDEQYFLYYEDADLSHRILHAGYEIVYTPQAKLWHVNAASSGSGSKLHDYFLTRNQMLFGMRYAPFRSKLALLRQSLRLLLYGRKFQKKGIKDYYLGKFGKGTFLQTT